MKLTDERIDVVLNAAYKSLVSETGYNGGMGAETWDRAAARAIEAEVLRLNGGGGDVVAHWNRGEGFSHCNVQRLDAAAVSGAVPLCIAPQPQQAAPGAVHEPRVTPEMFQLLQHNLDVLAASHNRRIEIGEKYGLESSGAVLEGWQPIETAPKDGTEILGWRDDCGALIVSFRSPSTMPLTQEELDVTDEETLFQEDWFTQWPAAERLEGGDTPTHWMPLPAAPSAPKPQGE